MTKIVEYGVIAIVVFIYSTSMYFAMNQDWPAFATTFIAAIGWARGWSRLQWNLYLGEPTSND